MDLQGKIPASGKATDSLSVNEIWSAVRQDLQHSIGTDTVRCWIDRLSLQLTKRGSYVLVAPTVFTRNYVREHFGDEMLHSLSVWVPNAQDISFTVERGKDGPAPGRTAAQSTPAERRTSRYRFETFVVGRANQLACASARDLAGAEPPSYRPSLLYLHAEGAHGKTHLLHAIGEAFREACPQGSLRCMTAEQFTVEFVQSLRSKSVLQFKKEMHACDLLLIDNIQAIAGRKHTEQEFLTLLEALTSSDRRIAITGNAPPSGLAGLEAGIRSRLAGGLAVEIRPPDAAMRREFALRHLEEGCSSIPGIAIDEDVAGLLADRLPADLRVMQGAVLRLLAEARLAGEAISRDLVLDRLTDLLQQARRGYSVGDICEAAARHLGVAVEDMVSKRRDRAVLRARQLACYLARKHTGESLTMIGRQMGGRSHATVLHAIRKAEAEEAAGGRLAHDLRVVERALGA